MNKGTIIICIIALVGIAYFDDIKNFITGDRDKASQIMQQYMQEQQGGNNAGGGATQGNTGGKTLLEQSSAGHFDGPYVNDPVMAVPLDNGQEDYTSETQTTGTTTRPSGDTSCNTCFGSGKCRKCSGRGWVTGYTLDSRVECAWCSGTGICRTCHGTGR